MEKEKIGVCDNIWRDTLAWMTRQQIGTELALINGRFSSLVDTELQNNRKWSMGELHIHRAESGTGAQMLSSNWPMALPVADSTLPKSINDFDSLTIWYIDQHVITFLHNIGRLLCSDVSVEFSIPFTEYRSWTVMARYVWPLVHDGVNTLVNMKRCHFALMRKHISPTVLLDCVALRRIHSRVLPMSPDDQDHDELSAGRDLYTWLLSPRANDRPLVLKLHKWKNGWSRLVENISESFLTAATPAKFVVCMDVQFHYTEHFNLPNPQTEEQLALEVHYRGEQNSNVRLLRSPANCDQLMNWIIDANEPAKKVVNFAFGDGDIGELCFAPAGLPIHKL